MRSLTAIAIAALTSTMTFGTPMFQVQNFDTGEIIPGINSVSTFTINKFNTSLGALTKVTFEISVEAWGGYYMVENRTSFNDTVTGTISQGISVSISNDDYLTPGDMPSAEAIQSKGFILEHTGDQEILTGPDYVHRMVSAPAIREAAQFLLFLYEGSETYDVDFHSRQETNHTDDGSVYFKGSYASSQGFLTVTYEYDAVPEATSMALLVLGIVALGLRRGNFQPKVNSINQKQF